MSEISDNLRKVPPQNLEAESCVLGSIMIANESINDVREILKADDFYREAHRKIFKAMGEIIDGSDAVDLITLSESLKSKNTLEAIGGSAYLASLSDFTPSAVNVAHYARIVATAAYRRSIIEVTRAAQDSAFDEIDDPTEVAGRLGAQLAKLQDGGPKTFRSIQDIVVDSLKRIAQAHDRGSLVTGIPTGVQLYDEGLGGIQKKELVIVAGRPGMGKTALAGNVAVNGASRGHGVAFISAESPDHEIVQRLLARATGIENRNLRRGKLSEREIPLLTARSGPLGQLPIWILHSERVWDRIKPKLRALKLKQPGLDLVIVDYVQLLSAPVYRGSERYLEIGRISAEAKNLASELDVGFVLLSQLNRDVESRGGLPRLSDLRESGNLEQDADIVALLWREAKYNKDAPSDKAELIIAKARNADTGSIPLRFDDRTVSFTDWRESETPDLRMRAAGA